MDTGLFTDEQMSSFAKNIMEQKYSHEKKDGSKESWSEIAHRVAFNVMKAVDAPKSLIFRVEKAIVERKFIPGGRYLFASGNPFHQTQNCALFWAEDSREGWSDLLHKTSMALMTGAGIGVVYSRIRAEGKKIRKTGGTATGPLALMQMINECGRGIMNGGNRRAAIWAGLHWNHPDIHKFIVMKNWSPEIKAMKAKDFNFPAAMDMTNISVILDDDFFTAFHNEKHKQHSLAHSVYWATIRQMLMTSEPGFSIDVGDNAGEHLRNAPVSGSTYVLTTHGYQKVLDIVNKTVSVYTGKQWASTVFRKTRTMDDVITVIMTGRKEVTCSKDHPFILEDGNRVEAQYLSPGMKISSNPTVAPGFNGSLAAYTLGALYGDGSFSNGRAELPLCGMKEKLLNRIMNCLEDSMTPTIGRDKRGILRIYFKKHPLFIDCSKDIFPEEVLGWAEQYRTNFLEGLLDTDGNDHDGKCRLGSTRLEFLRGVARLAESLGYSTLINKGSDGGYIGTPSWTLIIKGPTSKLQCERVKFYDSPHVVYKVISIEDSGKEDTYCCDVGVDEHSFVAEGVIVSNCTEITSKDDSDICNLGSINLARISSLEEMKEIVELGTAFLLAGTVYSDVPTAKIDQIRTKNRRLGLGLMGIHEWLLTHGKKYGPDDELEEYLKIYANSTEISHRYAREWDLSLPLKTRAIAPTGTIGIVAETTTGVEPIFCVSYKRRFLKHKIWNYQYVIDPTAKRLIDKGIQPEMIEDAYDLAENVERRVAFQAWVQQYVDHAISSTINMPSWGSELNNESTVLEFGNMLIKYLPKLRGVTVYADGSRGGQPLTPIKLGTALRHLDQVFSEKGQDDDDKPTKDDRVVLEAVDVCDITKGGTCGA